MRKLDFAHAKKTKAQISCAVTAQLISPFVFTSRGSKIPLPSKSEIFKPLAMFLWLNSPDSVGPALKP